MRLDLLLDTSFLLSSLWTGTAPKVCTSTSPTWPRAEHGTAWSSRQRTPAAVAFIDVNVVPMDTERVLPHQTVVVRDGHITALGPTSQIQVPAGAVQIDARGQYLMPGLSDVHFHRHIGAANSKTSREYFQLMASYLAHGITTVRPINSLTYGVSDVEELRKQERTIMLASQRGEGPGPRMYYAMPALPSTIQPDSVAAYLAAAKVAGYRVIHPPRGYRPQTSAVDDSLFAVGRRLGFVFLAHAHNFPFADLPLLGSYGGSLEHLYAVVGAMQQPGADTSAAGYLALGQAVARSGVFMSVTLSCWRKDSEYAQRFVKALQDGGVRLLVGSDVYDIGSSGNSVHYELRNLVRAGLTPYQALAAGTRNLATYLRLLDSSGTVAVGKRADMVLLRGNPLQDVGQAREPVGVMLAGRWLDRAALDQGLLADPATWFQAEIERGTLPDWNHTGSARGELLRLTDSLVMIKPSDKLAYEPLVQRATTMLGALREQLTPEQRTISFDPMARVWMREQARRGYPMTVVGVSPTP